MPRAGPRIRQAGCARGAIPKPNARRALNCLCTWAGTPTCSLDASRVLADDCGHKICYEFAHRLLVEVAHLAPDARAGGHFATGDRFEPVGAMKLRCTCCNHLCGYSKPLGQYLSDHGYADAHASLRQQELVARARRPGATAAQMKPPA